MAEKTTAPRDARPSEIGGWRDHAGREEFESAYRVAMAELPPPDRTWDVPTGSGTVRAYRFAPSAGAAGAHDRTPALLLPGWGAAVPMWGTNLPALLEDRPVYALDALGDAGLSVQTAPLRTADAQAAWIDQTLDGLGAGPVHVVGHSFGGWSATNLAVRRPDHVASLSLLDPVQTFSRIRWQVVLLSVPSTVPFLPQRWRDAALARIGGTERIDPTDPVTAVIAAGTRHYRSHRSFPALFTVDQLRALAVPVWAAMAGSSAVNGDPDAAVSRAREYVADVEARDWPGAPHSLPYERPEEVGAALRDFHARHDPA